VKLISHTLKTGNDQPMYTTLLLLFDYKKLPFEVLEWSPRKTCKTRGIGTSKSLFVACFGVF